MKKILISVAALLLSVFAFAQDLDDTWNYPPLLPGSECPNSLLILPDAPLPNDAVFSYDFSQYLWGKLQRKEERGAQAAQDAKLDIDNVLANFSPCMGITLTRNNSPALAHLLAGLLNCEATTTAKKHYMRVRPFVLFNEPSLTPEDESYLVSDGSYPSGHAAYGWAVALPARMKSSNMAMSLGRAALFAVYTSKAMLMPAALWVQLWLPVCMPTKTS